MNESKSKLKRDCVMRPLEMAERLAQLEDYKAACEQKQELIDGLWGEIRALRKQLAEQQAMFYVNMLRAWPGKSHEEIANAINSKIGTEKLVMLDDMRRMDWLASHVVEVRVPQLHGSLHLFTSQTISDEEDLHYHTSLREQIDSAMTSVVSVKL